MTVCRGSNKVIGPEDLDMQKRGGLYRCRRLPVRSGTSAFWLRIGQKPVTLAFILIVESGGGQAVVTPRWRLEERAVR